MYWDASSGEDRCCAQEGQVQRARNSFICNAVANLSRLRSSRQVARRSLGRRMALKSGRRHGACKSRGVQISRRWSNQKIRVTPRNAKWCREEVVEIFLRRYSDLCQPNYALNIPGGHGKSLTANHYSCPLI